MSTQYITGDSATIYADDLVPADFSGTADEIEALKEKLASWDLLDGTLISPDGKAAEMMITLDVPVKESGEPYVVAVVTAIRDLARSMFAPANAAADTDCKVYVTGQPIVSASINESLARDMVFLIPLVVIVLLGVLFFSFRRWSAVFLVLLTVIVAVVWAIGAMPLFGLKLSIITALLPVILMAVGSAYGIHVVTHYMDDVRHFSALSINSSLSRTEGSGNMKLQTHLLSQDEYQHLVYALVQKLLKPVFLAALTTFAGFISFAFTTIIPIRWFGVFASWGVVSSFLIAVTLIPSLLLLKGPPKKADAYQSRQKSATAQPKRRSGRSFDNIVADGLAAVSQRQKTVLALTVCVALLSVWGLTKLVIDNNTAEYFRKDSDVAQSVDFMNAYVGGTTDLSLVVSADTTEELLSPEVLGAVDDFAAWMQANVPEVGRVVGFTDTVKRINQVFNVDEAPSGYMSVTANDANLANDDFGFGFGFGEEESTTHDTNLANDDFGFGFGFSFSEEELTANDANLANDVGETAPFQAWSIDSVTAAGLVQYLSQALASGEMKTPADLVRELERMTNYQGAAYYEIPRDPARYGKTTKAELGGIVQNYLMLLSGGDFSEYANDPLSPTAIRSMIQLSVGGDNEIKQVIQTMRAYIAANFPESIRTEIQFDADGNAQNTGFAIGGSGVTESAITDLIVDSQIISIVIAVIVVLIILAVSYRSLAAGFIGALPLLIAIFGNFAVMGFSGIKLNIGTALIASLSVGIGIDYTIHIIDTFKREYQAGNDFLHRTFASSGKAIIINAVSVGLGFGVMMLSSFTMLAQFGGLIMLSMAISAVVSLTVIPVLLTTFKPKFIYRRPSPLAGGKIAPPPAGEVG
jgi:predicted RND superfamily exporter protein